jgi:hypothetical protein
MGPVLVPVAGAVAVVYSAVGRAILALGDFLRWDGRRVSRLPVTRLTCPKVDAGWAVVAALHGGLPSA